MLDPIEDRGGAAQHAPGQWLDEALPGARRAVRRAQTVRAVDDVSFLDLKGEPSALSANPAAASDHPRLLMHLMNRDARRIVYDGMQVGRALSLRECAAAMQMVFQDSYASLKSAPDDRGIDRFGRRCMV